MPSGQIDPTEGINVRTDVTDEDLTVDVPFEEDVLDPSGRPGQEGSNPDDPEQPTPPVAGDAVKFDSSLSDLSKVYDIDEFIADGSVADLKVTVPAGIARMMVKIDSQVLPAEELGSLGLMPEFDLVNPVNPDNPDMGTKLTEMGFPIGDDVKGKTYVEFDITGFIPLLKELGAGYSNFVITVTDNDGNTAATTLRFNKK